MIYFSRIHFFFMILAWSICSIAGLSLEEQLEQLKTEMREALQTNDKRMEALELQIQSKLKNQEILEARAMRVEELESKVQQQESLLTALQGQQSSINSRDVTILRQGTTTTPLPKSCSDLKSIGHVISGIYLVMAATSVDTVFCDFTQASSSSNYQKLIGHAAIKSQSTIFYVQRRSYFYAVGVPITYEISRMNIGGAMDLASGKFTAPVKGTYFFSWTGAVSFPLSNTTKIGLGIRFYKNSNLDANKIGSSYVSDTNTGYQIHPITLQSTINLLPNDKVWMEIYVADTGMAFYDSNWYYTHYTGWLLEQDFS